MAFSIAQFKSNIFKNGFLTSNRYDVQITPAGLNTFFPSIIRIDDNKTYNMSDVMNELSYRCVGASLPGAVLRTSDVNRLGTGILEKIPFSAGYTDVDLTFICDKNGIVYSFWYLWLNYIFTATGADLNSNNLPIRKDVGRSFYTTAYKSTYVASIDIKVYDNTNKQSVRYLLTNAFPISMNDTNISWADQNKIVQLTVKLSFKEWSLDEGNVNLLNSSTT